MDEDILVDRIVAYELGYLDRKHNMGYFGHYPYPKDYHDGFYEAGPINDDMDKAQRQRQHVVMRGWL